MLVKTSLSHPLRIDSVSPDTASGKIGMTLCPGKHQSDALSGSWCRDLDEDLKVIKNWGAEILISLNENHEFETFCVSHLPERAKSLGIEWMHMPIRDRWIPNSKFEDAWDCHGHLLKEVIQSGSNIVIHCLGGLGRTGLVAARLLIELGISNDKAIAMVREARPGAIETHKQELYIRNFSFVR